MTPLMPPMVNMDDEGGAEQHRGVSSGCWPPHMVPSQLKIFTPVGTAMIMLVAAKNACSLVVRPDREHVVRPDDEADEADGDAGERHEGVAEDRLAGEDRE